MIAAIHEVAFFCPHQLDNIFFIMSSLKLTREFASSYLKEIIPEYEEMLVFIEQNGGWINMPPKMIEIIDRLKLHNYPELYRSAEMHAKMLLLAFMSVEELNTLGAEFKLMSDNDKVYCMQDLVQFMGDTSDAFLESIPDTPEKEQATKTALNKLSSEDQAKAVKQAQIAMLAFLASFYSTISIMVHGRKMTDLVQAAEQGDDDAYCLAVQIDKRILSALPYFKERYEKAISSVEIDFLDKLHYRITNPLLRSKIRYKTLWLTFAFLDECGYLDGSLKHREILDICEEAGVGGHLNRIEDVGSLSKRLREYREFQKINQRSRH
ncbi:MAG TPA: hypothetical protein VMW10_11925 [Alphaproteobacteria bacterium]|nr:hypothetical protein [Alphaproteobacteria bacterium]